MIPRNQPSDLEFLENGLPVSRQGFGLTQNTYSGGRTGVSVNHFGGLSLVVYFGPTPEEASPVFFKGDPSTAYLRCFRAQIVVEDDPYNLEFGETVHFPFGYRAHFAIAEKGVEVEHSLTLINDALVFSLRVLKNPQGLRLRHRFEHHRGTRNVPHGGVSRTFSDWQGEPVRGGWTSTIHDVVTDQRWKDSAEEMSEQQRLFAQNKGRYPRLDLGLREATTLATFFGTTALEMRASHSGRIYFTGRPFVRGTQACALLFASDQEACLRRVRTLRKALPTVADERERSLLGQFQAQPQIEMGHPAFQSLLAHCAPGLQSLMPDDVPGAIRSNALYYWFWGWDTMMTAETCLLTGLKRTVPAALQLFRDAAHPGQGVGHMYTRTGKIKRAQAYSAQAIYPITLWREGAHSGSLTSWKDCYPFARTLFQRILQTVNASGLGVGESNTPDFPQLAGHDGHDISVFNNSLLYQGARCMEEMARALRDNEMAEICGALSRQMEKTFVAAFWNKEAGYFVDSIDSRSGVQRRSYPSYAIFWLTPFLQDLVGDKLKACGEFVAKNHRASRGFLMYPRWDRSFDGDGSQMAQVWCTYDVFLTRSLAAAGRHETLAHWIDACAWFWKQLTFIEGYSTQTVNDSGTPDCPGIKQSFALSVYYRAFFTGCAGLEFDRGGLTLGEGLPQKIEIARLPLRGAMLQLTLKGPGRYPKKLSVNGRSVKGTRKIPSALLSRQNRIVLERTTIPPNHPCILSMCGGELRAVEIRNANLAAEIRGLADFWLHFYAPTKPRLLWNGEAVEFTYHAAAGEGKVLLKPRSRGANQLAILGGS